MYYAFQFRGDTQNSQLSQNKFKEGIKYMRSIYINMYVLYHVCIMYVCMYNVCNLHVMYM